MHRGWSRPEHHLRKAAGDLLSKPAIWLLLPDPDQPAPAGEYRAARTECRARQGRAADRGRRRYGLSIHRSRQRSQIGQKTGLDGADAVLVAPIECPLLDAF